MKSWINGGEGCRWTARWIAFDTQDQYRHGVHIYWSYHVKTPELSLYRNGSWIVGKRAASQKITNPDWPAIAQTAPPEVVIDWLLEFGPDELRGRLEELLTSCGVGGGS